MFTLWMTGRIYKRLIREADLMGTSNQRLIKYIKLKVTSYYKIGMHPEDTQALIGRYIKKYRVGPFSLQSWSRLPYLLMTAMLADRRRKFDVPLDTGRRALPDDLLSSECQFWESLFLAVF